MFFNLSIKSVSFQLIIYQRDFYFKTLFYFDISTIVSTCVGDKGWIGFGMMDREYGVRVVLLFNHQLFILYQNERHNYLPRVLLHSPMSLF